jgi:hypothetical protein
MQTLVELPLTASPQVAARSTAASLLKRKTGSGMVKWRLHTHFEVDRSVPIRIDGTRRAGLWTSRKPTLRSSLQVLGVAVIDRLKPVLLSGGQSSCRTGLGKASAWLDHGFECLRQRLEDVPRDERDLSEPLRGNVAGMAVYPRGQPRGGTGLE